MNNKENVLTQIRKDLRALTRYSVLNKAYDVGNGYVLGLKATKDTIMGMVLKRNGSLVYDYGSLYGQNQTKIVNIVNEFLSE